MYATTNRTQRIASIIEKRRPLAEKIQGVEANLRSLSSALRYLEDHRNQLLTTVDDQNICASLQKIDFTAIQISIANELIALGKLQIRFCRDTLNIGVVGLARQGKSRLLQSLTGLTAVEIPDGDREHCTGVRSTIQHNPNPRVDTDTCVDIWFYSEQSFLDEVISPYYEKLHLGAKPRTITEFASNPLLPLPNNISGYAEPGAMYEHLTKYHKNLDKYRDLLREPSPRRISKDEIRKYVAQDNADGKRDFFNYLAVREVKIVCHFPNADVGKIALVDMPGLGNTGVGDEDRLIRTLGQDIDVALFVRMPKSSGDHWGNVDVRLYDKSCEALVDLPLELWSFMVLNQTGANCEYGNNSNNCQDFAEDIARQHINVCECLIVNCANSEEANRLLDKVLDYLEVKITHLDQKYASSCQQRLMQLQSEVNTELEKASKALSKSTDSDPGNTLFVIKFNKLWKDLKNDLEKLLKELRQKREAEDVNFKQQVKATLETCRNDTGIPTIEEIEKQNNVHGGYGIAYGNYLNEIRANLSKHFLSLDEGLKRSLDQVKSQVAEVLIEKASLGGLTEARGVEFIKAIAEQLPEELIPGKASELKFGFQMLADFELSYRGLIQHRIRQHLDGLTPNESVTLPLTTSPNAQQVLLNLKTAHTEAIYKCEQTLEDLLCEPSQAAFAIVEEFLDRILRVADLNIEWQIFLGKVRSQVWDEFKLLAEHTQIQDKWIKAIEQVTVANNLKLIQFLN